ncbi:hypothetical protein TGDOM2_305930 [Toxoplasma gondii GAB2-2007-GAL-DOM2]|uniref:Uncharacterized protein n=6 Tax=Toxoplasma gondii TaxID=5811 RepID=S7VWP3_TOXGG|nr:hypothetical protein TGGT1_305930 [Toxoplasma gondii GT1]KAF4644755.1 hypothetical protein TGRH88_017490 [Toxoplasma gondii]KFG30342.1 hypothetical protein TGP89_305930 [Toxoplasma gondii p89]KFG33445.1 hypothetical protein TGDOM2_305930 [Toxoplasma gondii GAB2-2007-GAL-DOM2]KFG45066.1 hypothetical protein TGFOU_305930 [Toxoplasma gondii FOU]RQX67930.1 hypothetical protein TGCAST_305930 [Toxoplasma gondii CAST]
MSCSIRDQPVWTRVRVPAQDFAPHSTTATYVAPSTSFAKFTQDGNFSAPVGGWLPVSHSAPEPQLWRRVLRMIVGHDAAPPDTETVGGWGFEFLGWKVNFCGHQRRIHAPKKHQEQPSLVFPYSESIYHPATASGLVPCLDDRGEGFASPFSRVDKYPQHGEYFYPLKYAPHVRQPAREGSWELLENSSSPRLLLRSIDPADVCKDSVASCQSTVSADDIDSAVFPSNLDHYVR